MAVISMFADGAAAQQGGGMFSSLLIMVPIFAIMYFLMIRPQQKKQKEREAMLSRVKAGDKVLLQGGMIGIVTKVADKTITVEIAERVQAEFASWAVADIISTTEVVENKEAK